MDDGNVLAYAKPYAKVALCAAGILTLVVLLWPTVGKARHGRGLHGCYCRLYDVARGIVAYRNEHGTYPPPFVVDSEGTPAHSWRVLILPYIGHSDLYEQYNFDEPWDGPKNAKLASRMPNMYRCPDDRCESTDPTTSYLAVVGANTMWPTDRKLTVDDVSDGIHDTILLVEDTNNRVHWMSPQDLPLENLVNYIDTGVGGPSSKHKKGAWVMSYADGYTEVIDLLPRELMARMLTTNGGEDIDISQMKTR